MDGQTKKFIWVLITIPVFFSCNVQDTDSLSKSILDSTSLTVEASMNAIAGTAGSVAWQKPSGQPQNTNFKLLGAKVSNRAGTADYIFMVDTTSNTASIQTITFKGKTIHYNEWGIPDDTETLYEIMEWSMKGALGL